MKRTISFFVSILLVFTMVIGCSSSNQQQAPKPAASGAVDESKLPELRTGTFPFRISIGMWYIMKNKMDVAQGFKIKPVEVTNGAAINEAFGAGLLDVAQLGTAAAVNSAAVYNAKILAEISEGAGDLSLFVRADSPIAKEQGKVANNPAIIGSAETIKKKGIIYPVGSLAQIGVVKYLEAFGLSLSDIKTVNMNYGQGYQAFKAGEGDILAVFAPSNYTAIKDGFVKVGSLYDLKFDVKNVVVGDNKALNDPKKKEQITALLKMLYEVNDKLAADKELQRKVLVDYYKEKGSVVDPKMLDLEMKESYIMTSEDAKKANVGSSVIATAEKYVEMGILEADKVNVIKGNIDTTIVKSILK